MSKSNEKSADEQSKKEVAEKVVTPKQKYFFPKYGKTVEATSLAEATKEVEKAEKEQK